jgi:hypothetical protein
MTYSVGGLIQATDYNNFVQSGANNINVIYGVGGTDKGYGQAGTLSTVSAGGVVTATQWASLVNVIPTMASHQGTTITSRTAPVAGGTIGILNSVQTDIDAITANRGNAVASGSEITSFSGTTSKTSGTGSGNNSWTITFTHTVSFADANSARYFWNAGGIVRLRVSKTSTGTQADTEWNDLAGTLMNEIRLVGRVNSANQTIASVVYTGVNKTVGTGTPSIHATTTGWYGLSTGDTNIYRQNADTGPYTGQYINVAARTAGSGTQLVLTTTWVDPGSSAPAASDAISGGSATNSPFSGFGTAPATVVTVIPPSSTYLTATWGTPSIAASVS